MPEQQMTYRVVSLDSRAAEESRLGATAAERLAMLAELSRVAWSMTGRRLPTYTRETIPLRLTTLQSLGAHKRP
jgi:hypothetical protein